MNGKVSRLRRYAEYKDSVVEWLDEVPRHWDVAPVYARYEVALGKMLDARRVAGEWPGRYLRNVDVQWDAVNIEDLPTMDFRPSERERYLLRPGDLLVCEGGEVGRAAVWSGELDECFYQKAIHRLRPRSNAEVPRFFFFLMYALARFGVFTAGGNPNTIDHLTAVQLRHLRVPFPPPAEQVAIATFLDRETAKIDGLVTKKGHLIELLREKRTALITRAVTRGLDTSAAMEDSGIEWLGEIPAHWHVKQLSKLTKCLDGQRVPLNAEERGRMQGNYPYWGATSIVDYLDQWLFDEELVLLGEDGAPFFDKTRPVAFSVAGKVWVNNHAHVLRPLGTVDPRFLAHALNCVDYRAFIDGSTRDKLTQGAMRGIPVQCPEGQEQGAIASYLDRETTRFEELISRVGRAINHLNELRTALISAAVTGKIDVREQCRDMTRSCDEL